MLVKCDTCCKTVRLAPAHVNKHNFCSRKCKGEWMSKNWGGKNNPNYRSLTLLCPVCGKKFKACPSRIERGMKYCSNKCYLKVHRKGDQDDLEETLRELYIRKGLSLVEIAKRFSCGHSTVCRWMDNLKIHRRRWIGSEENIEQARRLVHKINNDPKLTRKKLKNLLIKPTNPEKKVMKLIERYNFPFRYVGNGSFMIDILNPDFIHNNGEKKVIEVFGRVFHDPEKSFFPVDWKRQYFGRISYFAQFGYDCLILWDDELKDEAEVVERIRDFAGKHIELYEEVLNSKKA